MSIEKTILKYQKQGIRLFLENGKLCYNSPKGVMNKAIQEELSKIRDELIDFLAKSCSPVIIDKENLNEEFDLTNMQLAYTVGKGELYKYGQTNCKIYCEIKYPVIDIAKFKKSWTDVIIANEMLHAVIYNDGKQKILKDYNIPDIRYTKRCSKYHFNDEHLENVRKRLSSKTYELGKWPLYDIEITSFDDYSIIHLSLDMLIADFTSIGVIIRDLEDSYFEDIKLENKGITFRDIIVFDENFKKTSEYRINYNKAKDYWLKKIEDLPEGPTLTTKSSEGNVSIKQFNLRITEKRELEIQDICRRNKITLTVFILTAYAEVLSRWSSEKRFCINVTISERDDIHPNISSIVGDFTDINLLEISNLNENEFVENAQNIQLQLWKDIDNRSFSGIEVLREVSKSRKQNIIYPYVFTSALGIQENIKSNSISNFGELVYKITQTPQVILDCQVMRDKGGILITWDVRDNIFPKGMIESAFTRFSDIILNRRKENSSKDKEVLRTFGQSHILSSEFNDNMNFESFIGNLYLEEMASKIILNNYDQKYTYKKLGLLVRNIRDLLIINKCKAGDTVLINSPDAFLKVGAILAILSIGGGALPIDETEDLLEIESLNKKYDIKFALINDIDDFCLDGEIYKNLKIISLEQIEDFDDEKPDKLEITDIAKATLISKEMDQLGEMRFYPIKVKNIFSFVRKQIDLLKVRKADELLVCENNNSRVLITNLLICLLSQSTLNLCKNISQQKYNKMIMDSEFIQVNMHQLEVLCKNHIRKSKIKSIISKTLIVITAIDSMSLINQFSELLESFRIIFMIDDFTIQDNEQYMILCKEYVKMDHEDNLLSFNKNLSSGEVSILDQHLSMCPEWVVGDIFVNKKSNDESSSDIYNSTDQKNVLAKTKFRGMYTSDSIIVTHDSTGDVKLEGNDINVYEIESKINSLKDIHKSAIVPNKNDCSVDVFVQPNFSEATKDTRNIKFSEFNIKDVDDFNLDNFLRWMQASNETAIEDIFQTFLKLGVFVNKNKWYSIKEIYYETKVVDIYKRLLKRWLNALISEGIIKYNANRGYKLNSCRVDNIGKAWEKWKEIDLHVRYSDIMMNYFYESRVNLIKLLQGKINPVELFFPNGSFDVALAAYKNNPISNIMNKATIKYINDIIDDFNQRFPNKDFRILEVGGGVGGTTIDLMKQIKNYNIKYLFTDISQSFINEAEKNFIKYNNIDFGIYDINKDYFEQGMNNSEFDLIICNNVFHNANDESEVLEQFKGMLTRNGHLVILEGLPGSYALLTSMEFHAGLDHIKGFREDTDQVFLSMNDMNKIINYCNGDLVKCFPDNSRERDILGQCLYIVKFRESIIDLDKKRILNNILRLLPYPIRVNTFNVINSIPLTREACINRRKLRDDLKERINKRVKIKEINKKEVGPATNLEKNLVQIWKETLKVESLSINDNFFELGGDSLIAAQIASKMKQNLAEFKEVPWDQIMLGLIQSDSLREMCSNFIFNSQEELKEDNESIGKIILLSEKKTTNSACVLFHDGLGSLGPYSSLIPLINENCDKYNLYGLGNIDEKSFLSISPDNLISTLGYEYANLLEQTGEKEFELIGFCTGGLIAIETGKVLLEKGLKVNMVTTIDTMICKKMILNNFLLERAFAQLIGANINKAGHSVSDEEVRKSLLYLSKNYNLKLMQRDDLFLESIDKFKNVKECYVEFSTLDENERFNRMLNSIENEKLNEINTLSNIKQRFNIFSQSFEAAMLYEPENYVGDVKVLYCDNEKFTFLPLDNIDNEKFWKNATLGDIKLQKIKGNHLTCLNGKMASEVFKNIFGDKKQ